MDIDSVTFSIQDALQTRPEVIAVYLFGSLAQGKAHRLSDIDVAVLLSEELGQDSLFQQRLELGSLLEQMLRRPVDLVILNQAPPFLCFQILKTGQLIFESNRTRRCLFQMRAMNLYYDAKPYLDAQRAATIQRIREEGLGRGYHGHRDALAEARRLRQRLAAATTGPAR